MPNISHAVTKRAARNRTQDEAHGAEEHESAECRKEDEQFVHLRVLPDEPRSQHIVHTPDDERAEQGEGDPSPDLTGGDEDDRRW